MSTSTRTACRPKSTRVQPNRHQSTNQLWGSTRASGWHGQGWRQEHTAWIWESSKSLRRGGSSVPASSSGATSERASMCLVYASTTGSVFEEDLDAASTALASSSSTSAHDLFLGVLLPASAIGRWSSRGRGSCCSSRFSVLLHRVGCLGSASLAGASTSVVAADSASASSVRTTKKIEWVGVNRARGNMVIFNKN
jgi:hypothetical protein